MRTSHHSQAEEFEVILRQMRPFIYSPQLGHMVIRLFGSMRESKVTANIAEISKSFPDSRPTAIGTPELVFEAVVEVLIEYSMVEVLKECSVFRQSRPLPEIVPH